MVAERDGWLLQREARIASLEATIANLEEMSRGLAASAREREKQAECRLSETATSLRAEIAGHERVVREREATIERLVSEATALRERETLQRESRKLADRRIAEISAHHDEAVRLLRTHIALFDGEVARREDAVRDREKRIAWLENELSALREQEEATQQRERLALRRMAETSARHDDSAKTLRANIHRLETEIAGRENTVRDREKRIASLEGEVRYLETLRSPHRTDDMPTRLRDVVSRLPGWCHEEKATWMADHIRGSGYKVAAEIGVFAGRSLFPIALAIEANQGRAVYAVEAWDREVATSTPTDEVNDYWWRTEDLSRAKSQFLTEMVSQGLVDLIKVIELPSDIAWKAVLRHIGRVVEFLHIDGAHSEDQSISDAAHWSQLVVPGGTIVLDDIDWPSVRKANEFLTGQFERIEEITGAGMAFAAFRVS
jgi:Methyltransferase domain